MAETLSPSEVLRLRMHAQLLIPQQRSRPEGVAGVARHMLALQGQDWLASRWAMGVRAPGCRIEDVHAAFNSGEIVRSWPMRGTVHVVAAEDIGWMQQAMGARMLSGAPKRRQFLGMSDEVLDRVVDVSTAALTGGARLTRDELSAIWTAAGIDWQPSWRYHLVWWLCQTGVATLGPVGDEGGEPLLVLASDWIVSPRRLDGDEALAELAARYAGARGPVSVADFAWWTGLTQRDAKRAFALAAEAGRVTSVLLSDSAASAQYWVAVEALGSDLGGFAEAGSGAECAGGWQLLPAFDEHLLGYTRREPQLAPGQLDAIVPGKNGVFRPTLVRDGITVGTWKRAKPRGAQLLIAPFPGVPASAAESGLGAPLARWAEFHGVESASLEVAGAGV